MSQELPPVPPPPPPRPRMGQSKVILAGCGIGCGVIVVVLVGAVVGLSFAIPSLLRPSALAVIKDVYEKAQENKNLTKDQLAVYDDLVAEIDYPQVNGLAAMTGAALFHDHLKDGALTEAEIAEASILRDYLQANPDAGMFDMMRFQDNHPEIAAKMTEFQRNPANLRPN